MVQQDHLNLDSIDSLSDSSTRWSNIACSIASSYTVCKCKVSSYVDSGPCKNGSRRVSLPVWLAKCHKATEPGMFLFWFCMTGCLGLLNFKFPVQCCLFLSVSVQYSHLAVRAASEMTRTVSCGAQLVCSLALHFAWFSVWTEGTSSWGFPHWFWVQV